MQSNGWKLDEILLRLFAARIFGHGRRMELFLVSVCSLYGVILFFVPGAAWDSQATRPLYNYMGNNSWWISLPFLLKAFLSGLGLYGNIQGWPVSVQLRFCGALVGLFIWIWYAIMFYLLGTVATIGFPFCVAAAFFSIGIMAMAVANLPRPGAPGALGISPVDPSSLSLPKLPVVEEDHTL